MIEPIDSYMAGNIYNAYGGVTGALCSIIHSIRATLHSVLGLGDQFGLVMEGHVDEFTHRCKM